MLRVITGKLESLAKLQVMTALA